jgi:nuclear transport factor 2 (NTF2) superfamily protein
MRPFLPSFSEASATEKVRLAEDAWNAPDPAKVALAYTAESQWRNRAEVINGRTEIEAFLTCKWARELDYRLVKKLWALTGSRIAVRFAYKSATTAGPGSALTTIGGSPFSASDRRPGRPRNTQQGN